MEMTPVTSSNVLAVGYDHGTGTLGVSFKSGGTYHYDGVPVDVYTAMLSAESVGQFFHQNVKGIYPYRKVS